MLLFYFRHGVKKKYRVFLFLLCVSQVTFSQANIDVLHYKYEIELSDTSDNITGRATITVKFLQNTHELSFDLATLNNSGKGMRCTVSSGTNMEVEGNSDNNKYIVHLPVQMPKGDTATFILNYSGIPEDGLIISKNKYGKRTFFADNWPNRGHNWIPCHDDPADKASVEFIITAPLHYQVVSNGIKTEETNLPENRKKTHWTEEVPISTKVMVIGAAEFAVNLAGTVDQCIPVYSWVYPENRENGFYDYGQALEILPWYISKIGPYAYKKLANVQSKTIFGGLENANTIFYSEYSVTGDRKSEALLAHEIAHQWFGNYVTEKSFAHLWLSEGFATYLTIIYMENKYGKDTALHMLQEDRIQAIQYGKHNELPIVNPTTDYMKLLNPNSYQKGSWVLHMLRRQLGDSVFWKSLRYFYSVYGGKTADTDDLRKIFEEVAGKDLKKFFQQWLYTPVNPALDIRWKYFPQKKNIIITVSQNQSSVPFEFPLELAIVTDHDKTQIIKLNVSKKTESFTFSLDNKPSGLYPDPNTSLLSAFTFHEIK
jgi:aminopeptidase N